MKPFSQACANNRAPILAAIAPYLATAHDVLEIGSGTGQHAVHFGAGLRHLRWHTSDRGENHAGILAWLAEEGTDNLLAPLALDVDRPQDWPARQFDAVFSANTAHIMGWASVCNMLHGVARVLAPGGPFLLYGPFARGGLQVSESNRRFDRMLRTQDPAMGVRDLDDLERVAGEMGLVLETLLALPANNHLGVWRRTPTA